MVALEEVDLTIHAEGNKPITIQMELEHKIPAALYREFNYKV